MASATQSSDTYPAPLLAYAVATEPNPIQVSPENGDPKKATIIVTVNNQYKENDKPFPVYVKKITFKFTIGADSKNARVLTTDGEHIKASAEPANQWQITHNNAGTFTATLMPGASREIKMQGLIFTIHDIQVNQVVGTCIFTIEEYSSLKADGTYQKHTTEVKIPKFPSTFTRPNFRSDESPVPEGGKTTLRWEVSQGANYTIEWNGKTEDVTKKTSWTTPTLEDTTQFKLKVTTTSRSQPVTFDLREIVLVTKAPVVPPKIQQFTGKILWKKSKLELEVRWKIEGSADAITIKEFPGLLRSPEGKEVIKPTLEESEPLRSSYTLDVLNKAGKGSSTLTIGWDKVQSSIQLDRGAGPQDMAIAPNSRYVFVANYDNNSISVIKMNDGQPPRVVGAPIRVGNAPVAVAVSPDNTRLFVANAADNTVSVVSLSDEQPLQVISTISVGHLPSALAISPDSTRLFVANAADNTVSVIDAQSLQIIGAPIRVGNAPVAVAISPDGTRLFVANAADNTVSVIDAQSLQIIGAPIRVGNAPVAVATSPDNTHIFIINSRDNTISIMRRIDDQPPQLVGAPIPVGNAPIALAISPDNTRLFVANRSDNTVSMIVPSAVSGGTGQPSISTERQEYIMTTVEQPVGTIISYVGTKESLGKLAEEGWLLCDGRKLERKTYAELFAAIGSAFGGDATFFYAPDLRGMFLRGVNDGSGKDPEAAQRMRQGGSSQIGDVVGSWQNFYIQNHKHSWYKFLSISIDKGDTSVPVIHSKFETQWNWATDDSGGGPETRPINVAVYYLIKAFSSFSKPSQG